MHAGRDLTECGNIGSMTPGSDECIEKSLSLIVGRADHKMSVYDWNHRGEESWNQNGQIALVLSLTRHWGPDSESDDRLVKNKNNQIPPPPVTPSPKLTLKAQCESFSSIRNLGNEMTCRPFQCWTLGLSTWKYKAWKIPSLCSLLRESERARCHFLREKPTQGWSLDI